MSIKVKGFDELEKKLESLGNVGRQVSQKAVRSGMKPVLEQLKADAPKDTGSSAKALRVTKTKYYPKTGSAIIRAGIDSKNWDKTKGLYYAHYSFTNHINDKKVTKNVGWMNKSFEKSKSTGEKEIIKVVQEELDKILG